MRNVNAMVGRFYRCALNVPVPRFRETLLRDMASLVPFDAALWGTADADAEHFHSLTLLGLDQEFSRNLEQTRRINPMFHRLIASPDEPVDMADLIPDNRFYSCDVYKKICRPFNIERVLGTSCRDPRSGVYNLVALFRFDRNKPFSKTELRIQRQLVFHMMNAMSLAYSVYLSHVSAQEVGSSAAICDRHGVCYDLQPSFLSLIEKRYPQWQGGRLPFDLPAAAGVGSNVVQDLRISSTPIGDLLCVRAWKPSPLDKLTRREREIVTSVCRGLSYKEVARPLGIAPSTVSNHVYRVFEKLGVSSRSELARMFNQARHLH